MKAGLKPPRALSVLYLREATAMRSKPLTPWVANHHSHQAVDHLRDILNSLATLPKVAIHPEVTRHNQDSSRVLRAKDPLDGALRDTHSREHLNSEVIHHKDISLAKTRHTPNQDRTHNNISRDNLQCKVSGVVLLNKVTLLSKDTPLKAKETLASHNEDPPALASKGSLSKGSLKVAPVAASRPRIHGRILA